MSVFNFYDMEILVNGWTLYCMFLYKMCCMSKVLSSLPSFYTLVFTFAVLIQGVAVVTRFAVLAVWSHRVVEAAQTFSRQAVAAVAVIRLDVVVAGTLCTAGTW